MTDDDLDVCFTCDHVICICSLVPHRRRTGWMIYTSTMHTDEG